MLSNILISTCGAHLPSRSRSFTCGLSSSSRKGGVCLKLIKFKCYNKDKSISEEGLAEKHANAEGGACALRVALASGCGDGQRGQPLWDCQALL